MTPEACVESDVEFAVGLQQLRCRIIKPNSTPSARLLIVHGYGEHGGRYLRFMRWLACQGVVCEAVDLRGHGRSSGRRGFVRKWDEYLDDLSMFLSPKRRNADSNPAVPTFCLAHSHGGLVVAAAGERGLLRDADIRGCVLASPYLATQVPPPLSKRAFARVANVFVPWLRVRSNLRPDWLSTDPEMLAEDRADALMNRSATPRWFFTMRIAQARVMAEASAFTIPMLCLTGDADLIADAAATLRFFEQAASPDKSLYTYPSRLHELLRERGRDAVFNDILAWMRSRTANNFASNT